MLWGMSSVASDPPVPVAPRSHLHLVVQITEDDIAKGQPSHAFLCPGALAIQRALDAFGPDMGNISVAADQVCWRRLHSDGIAVCIAHASPSPTLASFIMNVDCGWPVSPLDVEIDFYPLPRS